MTFDESCIFCKIARKQAPASIIYEDEEVMAFLDIRPLNEGHTLVIPKKHYIDIFDIPEDQISKVHKLVKQVSRAIKQVTNADGISIIQQSGKAAGQDIFHFHVHSVPRFGGQKLPSFSSLKEVERAKLEETAKKIKRQLKNVNSIS
ncbi:MAG: HIT family protein [Candidatus Bathyarchaeia archaeon]